MVDFNIPLPNQSNTGNAALAGFETGQNLALKNAQILGHQEQIRQRQLENERMFATQSLARAAVAGDPNSLAQLSAIAPEAAKGIRDYNNYKLVRGGQLWQSVTTAPKPMREKLYSQAIKQYENEFGEAPSVPAQYSPEAEGYLKGLIAQSRDVEKVAAEEFERPLQQAKLGTEYLQQGKLRTDIAKGYEDLIIQRDLRKQADAAGMSITSYKKQQENLGEVSAKRAADLPRIENQATQSIKLIDEIVNHPGMTSMVGSRLGWGSVNTYLPNVLGGKEPIAGTDAANFKAKLDQLQGQQFLEAYETLKGGGQITEIEGKKATDAIASMQTSQSEKQFKKSAEDLKDVIRKGLSRAKKGIVVNRNINQAGGGGADDPLGLR